jgi:hypothetical protein
VGITDGISTNLIPIVLMTGVEMDGMDPNEEVLSVCEVDGKPTVFVLHESD